MWIGGCSSLAGDRPRRPQPEHGQLRAGTHSDYGFLTILRSQASAGGLQAQSRDGAWIDVPALDGAFVNLGDALMRMTNDRWVSTPHRVVNPPEGASNTRRQSIPYFHNPAPDAFVRCLEPFVSTEPARALRADHLPRLRAADDACHARRGDRRRLTFRPGE